MTTFGGHTVPPLFGAGAAAPPPGNIFLRSTGDFYDSQSDGTAQQNIPDAPTINVDDDLYVLSVGPAAGPVNAADWTLVFTGFTAALRVYRRRADGTASDQYTMAAHSVTAAIKMACFGNLNQPTTNELVPFQGGFINTTANALWGVDGMTANTSQDPFACAMLFAARANGGNSACSVDSTLLPTVIGQICVNDTTQGSRLWVSWEFDNQIPSIAYANFLNLLYSPVLPLSPQWTQYQRFGLF